MERKIVSVKLLHYFILITSDCYTEEDEKAAIKNNKVITFTSGDLKPFQHVIAVGPLVKDIQIGDCVKFNPQRYLYPTHKEQSLKDGIIGDKVSGEYRIPTVEINGEKYFKITDADIDYIAEFEDPTVTSTGIIYKKPEITV